MTTDAGPITGFSHLQLRVRDLDASARWWTAVLGVERFAEGPLVDGGRYVAMRHPVAWFVIGLQTTGDGAAAAPATIDHLSFGVVDRTTLDAHCDTLRAAGIEVGPVFDEVASHNVRLQDPDGLVVELSAPRAR